jgi:hypothetical protein
MLKSYEAIYDHGHIEWLGEVPRFKRVRVVLVADDAAELDEAEAKPTIEAETDGSKLLAILNAVPPEVSASIAETFGDPVAWQREQRRDRILPGREDA